MPLELQDVHFRDGPGIAKVHVAAFFDDPFQKCLFPGMSFDNQIAGTISRWPKMYADTSVHYKKVVDTESGEIVSYSKWTFAFTDAGNDLQKPMDLPEDFDPEQSLNSEGRNDAFANDFSRKVAAIREPALGERPQLQLKLMVTLPTHARRGAASLQLSWGLAIADEHALTCWVEASPIAAPLYKKFGFEVKDMVECHLDEHVGGGMYKTACLMRVPRMK